LPTKETKLVENEFRNNSDFIRTSIALLHEYDHNYKAKCECLESGKYLKHSVDYSKPISKNNQKIIFKDHSIRL
jgi:Arc/MetJ-type ribon-helix-helix transcriptional regulator